MKGKSNGSRKDDHVEITHVEEQCSKLREEIKKSASGSGGVMSERKRFDELPLSSRTQGALKMAGYLTMTDIQLRSLPLALVGLDVLGAAKTGSGKTLAFVVPIIERLWRLKWTAVDGIGAIVITPTRELAFQIFEVLRKVGNRHDLSAGLVIGGKDVEAEAGRILRMNIIVCTPGRLLQHMDETPGFDCSNLQMLVLDEADRILDMGFANTLNAILENVPKSRQTLLFSATQTKSVRDLARLSLVDPEYVAVHENAPHSTPQKLSQFYIVCQLQEKLDILYSFIRSHLKCKILVFLSSCKQVRFVYECFRRLRPGVPLMALYGKQKQMKRMSIYSEFANKSAAVLFATDIAARGLDFPAVHWVIQVDCPEDASTYIHRVGRTARYEKEGNALLMLLPSEVEGMTAILEEKRIPLQLININPTKNVSIKQNLQAFCIQDTEMKYLAQKSFVSYMRSVFLQPNKQVFDVFALPADEFASSLGLPGQPNIRFMKRAKKKLGAESNDMSKNGNWEENVGNGENKFEEEDDSENEDSENSDNENDGRADKEDDLSANKYHNKIIGSDSESDTLLNSEDSNRKAKNQQSARTKLDRIRQRKNMDVLSEAYAKLRSKDTMLGSGKKGIEGSSSINENDENDDFLKLRRSNHGIDGDGPTDSHDDENDMEEPEETSIRHSDPLQLQQKIKPERIVTKAKAAKKIVNAGIKLNTKIVFDDEGNATVESGAPNITSSNAKFSKSGGDAKQLEEDHEQTEENAPISMEELKRRMKEADRLDRLTERQKIKEKHREKVRKLKERRRNDAPNDVGGAILLPPSDSELQEQDSENESDSFSEDLPEMPQPSVKSSKRRADSGSKGKSHKKGRSQYEDEESLALALLNV